MNPVFRKVLASLSVMLGVVLLVLELRGEAVSWFWATVAAGMVVLGMLELLTRKDPMIRP